MNPTDSNGDLPDITLALHKNELMKLRFKLATLQYGQSIVFNATIDHLGDEWSFHFFHLLDFELLPNIEDPLKLPQFEYK